MTVNEISQPMVTNRIDYEFGIRMNFGNLSTDSYFSLF